MRSRTLIRWVDSAIGHVLDRQRSPSERRGVAVIMSGGIGDAVVFSVLAPRFLPLARDGEAMTLILRADSSAIGFLYDPRFRIEAIDYKRFLHAPLYRLAISRRLYGLGFRLVVSADYHRHALFDEALVAACRAPETAAMEPRVWGKYQDLLLRNRRLFGRLFDSGGERRHKALRWTDFANWLTGARLPPPRLAVEGGQRFAPSVPPVAIIHPFASEPKRQHPLQLYRAVVDALPTGSRILLTGGPGDLDRSPEYRPLLDDRRVRYVEDGFATLMPVLERATLVVSVNTSLMHLAAVLGIPTVGVGDAAWVDEIAPYPDAMRPPNFEYVFHAMPCQGCLQVCHLPAEGGRYPCVARLDADRVMAAVRAALVRGNAEQFRPGPTPAA